MKIKTAYQPIYADSFGQSERPLLLGLHGWSQRNGRHSWQPLAQLLAAAGWRVVLVDMPGWGDSRSWRWRPMSWPRNGVAAVWQILDGLAVESAVLLGKSWGGGIALAAAAADPQRILKLILTAPVSFGLTRLAGVKQPVLLSWAKDDPVRPYRKAAAVAAALQDCRLISYERGGHNAAIANAAAFAPRAIDFLNEL